MSKKKQKASTKPSFRWEAHCYGCGVVLDEAAIRADAIEREEPDDWRCPSCRYPVLTAKEARERLACCPITWDAPSYCPLLESHMVFTVGHEQTARTQASHAQRCFERGPTIPPIPPRNEANPQ